MTHFPETRAALARTRKIIGIIGFWQYLISALRLDEAKEWCARHVETILHA